MDGIYANKLFKASILSKECNGKCAKGIFATEEINDSLSNLRKLEADIAVARIVNNKLVERLAKTERQCWENAQYSQRDTLEIVDIPDSGDNTVFEETARGVFKKICVEID